MVSKVFDESTKIGRVLKEGDPKDIITHILCYLKKINVEIDSAIEIGPGGNVIPAAVFLENNIAYYGLDVDPRNVAIFRRNLLSYFDSVKTQPMEIKKMMGNLHLSQSDTIELKQEFFQDIPRPLAILFYDSISYLNLYATKTKIAMNEEARKKIVSSILNKFYTFLKKGDVMICVWTLSSHMPYGLDAEDFYSILKKKKFETKILVQFSSDLAIKLIQSHLQSMCNSEGYKNEPLLEKWGERLETIKKQKKPVIFGVVLDR